MSVDQVSGGKSPAQNIHRMFRAESRKRRHARYSEAFRYWGLPILAALTAIVVAVPAAAGPLQSAISGRVKFACIQGTAITVDFDKKTVTDSVSDTPMPAQISGDVIRWHSEFDTLEYDSRTGNHVVHHTADRALDRRTGRLNSANTCQ
jgi:hypothetical protein